MTAPIKPTMPRRHTYTQTDIDHIQRVIEAAFDKDTKSYAVLNEGLDALRERFRAQTEPASDAALEALDNFESVLAADGKVSDIQNENIVTIRTSLQSRVVESPDLIKQLFTNNCFDIHEIINHLATQFPQGLVIKKGGME